MLLRRIVRLLLEPARDPFEDSFAVSLKRASALRVQLREQISRLHSREVVARDAGLEAHVRRLEAEYARLLEVERRVTGELDCHRARHDLLTARQTAAEAQDQIQDLLGAIDQAHARAAALAESVGE